MIGQPLPDFALQPAVGGQPGPQQHRAAHGPAASGQHLRLLVHSLPDRGGAARRATRRGIPVDGIAVRDRPEDLAAFLATYGDPYRAIGADVDRRVQLDIGSAGVPETFVIDGRGIIRHQHIGAITDADLPEIMSAYQEAAR